MSLFCYIMTRLDIVGRGRVAFAVTAGVSKPTKRNKLRGTVATIPTQRPGEERLSMAQAKQHPQTHSDIASQTRVSNR